MFWSRRVGVLGFGLGLWAVLPTPSWGQEANRPDHGSAPRPMPRGALPSRADHLLEAIARHPTTAPYAPMISAFEREDGRVVLQGVVGTKVIHDAAVGLAIESGIPFVDNLVIDTAAATDVALRGASMAGVGARPDFGYGYGYGGAAGFAPTYGASPLSMPPNYPPPTYTPFGTGPGGAPTLVYPPPAFGYLDEPFYGFEPPVISYPPWWGGLSWRRTAEYAAHRGASNAPGAPTGPPGAGRAYGFGGYGVAPNQPRPYGVDPRFQDPANGRPNARGQGRNPRLPANPDAARNGRGVANGQADSDARSDNSKPLEIMGEVEMTINPAGVATLRGRVPTLADRIAVGQYLAQTPGVNEVINLLNVSEPEARTDEAEGPRPERRNPRPRGERPRPPAPREDPAEDDAPPVLPDLNGDDVGGLREDALAFRAPRVLRAHQIARRARPLGQIPELRGLPIQVELADGVARLSGRVPTALEAMRAYTVVSRRPEVESVEDRLKFSVPLDPNRNPLRTQGDRDAVEDYLKAQARRQLEGQAKLDRLELFGDRVEARLRIKEPRDRRRIEAILRSTPVLRGFTIATTIRVDPEL